VELHGHELTACWLYAGLTMIAGFVRPIWQAGLDSDQGVADLRVAVANAAEWKRVSYGPGGGTGISAERAVLQGMLDHIERARAASPYRRLPIYHETP
jgi:hypothetical protein